MINQDLQITLLSRELEEALEMELVASQDLDEVLAEVVEWGMADLF
jgi:hypothetical protein